MNWSRVFCMFGMALTRRSLTMQLTSGMDVFAHVCEQKPGTLSNYCDNIQPHDKSHFCFCQMWHDFYIVFLEIITISYFKISQGSAATYWRCGGKYYMSFVGNLLGFQQWKNCENQLRIDKLIAISLVHHFFGTQCSLSNWFYWRSVKESPIPGVSKK